MKTKINSKSIRVKVYTALKSNISMREDDKVLCVEIWKTEAKEKRLRLANFLPDYMDGKYTSAEHITRTRRRLQEEFKSLRGRNWNERRAYVSVVKKALKK